MKLLIKTIVVFAIAFFLLIPTTYLIDTTFTQIENAAQDYSDSSGTNITTNINNQTSLFRNSFLIVYALWGISFVIFLIIAAFKDKEDYEYYG